ncbi:MAG: hypothetical protein ACRD08_20760 [Acidimicrobiales bacterium]
MGLLVLALRQARAKGAAAALHMAAGGFLLVGASAVGIVEFVAGIVLSPLAWVGVGFLALAGVLFVVGQKLEGRVGSGETAEVTGPGARGAIAPAPKSKGKGKAKAKAAPVDDDLADIEAILRKHGIQ